ncbi:hypothetical protein CRG98_042954 [Punica granatum]|uniref:RING-type E3 ubiquitin transferase n=1 Tax=Punica granatum TaxID=22663 RepID=A0A2I0HY76_PUNGR|nr:hypothetical protein CRG98_042954 [Punica granatum]
MFALTFILLIYAKFCHRGRWVRDSYAGNNNNNNAFTRSRRFSGINKTVIESLPFFRFSSLRGSRAGLECAVCLSKFEDIEILRLLPNDRFSALEPFEGNTNMTADHRVENDRNQIGRIKEEMDRKRLFESKLSSINKTGLISGPSTRPVADTGNQLSPTNGSNIISDVVKRSQSEITAVSRFGDSNIGKSGRYSGGNRKEDRRRQLWLPIARRTVQWFANRERRSRSHQDSPDVNTKRQTPDSIAV